MDSMEVNKGIAALLVGGIAFFLTGLLGDLLVREELPLKPVLNIAAAPEAVAGGGEAKPRGAGADRSAAGDRGREDRRSVRASRLCGLPYLRQGRQERRRPEPLWCRRRSARP